MFGLSWKGERWIKLDETIGRELSVRMVCDVVRDKLPIAHAVKVVSGLHIKLYLPLVATKIHAWFPVTKGNYEYKRAIFWCILGVIH